MYPYVCAGVKLRLWKCPGCRTEADLSTPVIRHGFWIYIKTTANVYTERVREVSLGVLKVFQLYWEK